MLPPLLNSICCLSGNSLDWILLILVSFLCFSVVDVPLPVSFATKVFSADKVQVMDTIDNVVQTASKSLISNQSAYFINRQPSSFSMLVICSYTCDACTISSYACTVSFVCMPMHVPYVRNHSSVKLGDVFHCVNF